MNRKLTSYSYASIIASLITMLFFYLLLKGFIPINFRLGIILIGIMILTTFVSGVMACFKDDEKNYLAVISFFIGAFNLSIFGFALFMSQMSDA